ncbi:MAG: bifunctional oligoribonuclease/PAP phosphatase NrnA [Phycisphaerales bacterium]|jgi:phosphoesterase RecJ-like protein
MASDKDFQKAIELINKSGNVLITTHTRPDGDACGCIVAMSDALTSLGKKTSALMLSPMPNWYEFLFPEKVPVLGEDIQPQELVEGRLGKFDLLIIVDANSSSQLPKIDQYLKHADIPVLIIDHHATADGLGDIELVDSSAAATALVVYDFLKFTGWAVTEKIAESLFVAIATDTGWFQFRNADSRVYRTCAELIDAGAKPIEIHENIYQNFSHNRFNLMTTMLNTLELHLDGKCATQHILRQDFENTGTTYSDTENLINECQRISKVKVAALFVELKDGQFRCSLRSKGGIDVSKIAAKFGGGGHKMAAGTYLPGPVENARQLILNEISKEFN